METKKAPKGAIETHGKNTLFPITSKVLELFKTMEKFTAVELNRAIGFNDGRKAVSLLRKDGYPIVDKRISNRRKIYFLSKGWEETINQKRNNQLNLFYNDTIL